MPNRLSGLRQLPGRRARGAYLAATFGVLTLCLLAVMGVCRGQVAALERERDALAEGVLQAEMGQRQAERRAADADELAGELRDLALRGRSEADVVWVVAWDLANRPGSPLSPSKKASLAKTRDRVRAEWYEAEGRIGRPRERTK